MKLFLVRHGQTTGNLDATFTGQRDVPLTDEGRRQAESIRPILEKIAFDRVYSSDLSRAVDTQLIAVPGVQGIRTPLLREVDVGRVEGQLYAQVRIDNPGWSATVDGYARFGGETSQQICDRVRAFLRELESNPCENVVAFVHNGIMGTMMSIVLDTFFDRSVLRTNNCAINVFDFDGSKWRLLAWNYKGDV